MSIPIKDSQGHVGEHGLESKVTALERQILELERKYLSLLSAAKGINSDAKEKNKEEEEEEVKPKDALNEDPKTDGKIDEPSQHSRVKIIKNIKNLETGERIERQDDMKQPKVNESGKYAFTLKKTVNDKFTNNENDNSEIDILSLDLWELLKEHLSDYPNHKFRGPPVTLLSPYEPVVFKWDTLQSATAQKPKDGKDKQAREDLKTLLDLISGGSSGDAQLDKYFKVRELYRQETTIRFEDLWTIFPPGTLVYGKPFQDQDQVFIVRDNQGPWPERDDDRPQQFYPWKLSCWIYDWTGEAFRRTCFTLTFEQFEGHRPLTALPYFPFALKCAEDKTIRERLINRGQRFRKLCNAKDGSRLFDYEGNTIFGKKGFSGLAQSNDDDDALSMLSFRDYERARLRRRRQTGEPSLLKPSSYINSRVMVDFVSYFQYGPLVARNGSLDPSTNDPDCMCSDCQINEGLAANYRTKFDKHEAWREKNWEDEQYILCPPRVLGYILKDKQWSQLQVDLVKDIPKNNQNNAWNSRLQLADTAVKDMLFDLVRSHISSATQSTRPGATDLEVDDIIPGKGKGLVILLYGPPGVGKTSTAETVAVATRKLLFSISVADVGTQARHVEYNLSKIFSLAASWQAILLIDEADVFLESRGRGAATSTDRNALVSVFLRVLEYYQGIMFLTTNQIAQFDVAIPSRIHVSIQYQSLRPLQMKQIFKGFLQPLDEKGLVNDYDDILDWLEEDVYDIGFDGRQIRNIVTTALSLARAERNFKNGKGKLTKKHLKSVVSNAGSFKRDFAVQYDRYITAQEKLIG